MKGEQEYDSSKIKVLRNGRWQPMYRPVIGDRPFSGVCLAESFAEAYSKKYNVDVGLIGCADGGTSLEQWKPGGLLYDHAVYQAKLANRTSTIAGVLWHQGEADYMEHQYTTYKERFEVMLKAFRKDLELYDVPFLLGGLGEYLLDCDLDENLHNYSHVNNALKAIANSNPMVEYVPAEGLTANEDNLHFNSKSLYEFGLRYFEQFESIKDINKVFSEKPCEEELLRNKMEAL